MKDIFNIYKNDIKRIFKNKVTLITILILCIIPSLYAWINIKACWDPYSNTGNLPIAVVNKDKGGAINGKEINVGGEVEKNLKGNSKVKWVITDEWQGSYGLNEGKYYALIEIPEDFTNKFLTLASGNPEKPKIIYKSNEKANAIATKITAVAKDSLKKEITKNFVNVLNTTGVKEITNVSGDIGLNKGIIFKIQQSIENADKNIDNSIKLVEDGNKTSKDFREYMEKLQGDIPLINDGITKMEGVVQSGKEIITSTHGTINTIASNLREGIIEWQSINAKINMLFETSANNPQALDMGLVNHNLGRAKRLNNEIIGALNAVNSIKKSNSVDTMLTLAKDNQKLIERQQELLKSGVTADRIKELIEIGNKINENLVKISNEFYNFTVNDLKNKDEFVTSKTETINGILEDTRGRLPRLNTLTELGITTSKMMEKDGEKILEKLVTYQGKLNTLEEKTNSLKGKGIDEIINILGENPERFGNFMSSPIDVKEEEIYKGGVFGVGITPFYTVLAIWVGSLLTASLLSTHYKGKKDGKKLSLYKVHFGKMGLFLTISLIQGLIVTLGNVYILGVEAENFGALIGMSVLCSFTFTVIIFSLASVFGNVGKAIAVIIMVFQIAGAGGLYPIQTTPKLFQIINPFLPFTYAINGFREGIGGIEETGFFRDVFVLLGMSLIFISLVILKPYLHKLIHWFEERFEEAGI